MLFKALQKLVLEKLPVRVSTHDFATVNMFHMLNFASLDDLLDQLLKSIQQVIQRVFHFALFHFVYNKLR